MAGWRTGDAGNDPGVSRVGEIRASTGWARRDYSIPASGSGAPLTYYLPTILMLAGVDDILPVSSPRGSRAGARAGRFPMAA